VVWSQGGSGRYSPGGLRTKLERREVGTWKEDFKSIARKPGLLFQGDTLVFTIETLIFSTKITRETVNCILQNGPFARTIKTLNCRIRHFNK
jgi:hypothetical protein